MLFLMSYVFADPSTSLFVNVDGGYVLDITMQEEWSEAELRIDHMVGLHQPTNFRHLHFEGTFESIPDALQIRMELAKNNVGRYVNVHVPTLYMPFSSPDLSGNETYELPSRSIQWRLYRHILYPLRQLIQDE